MVRKSGFSELAMILNFSFGSKLSAENTSLTGLLALGELAN